MGGSAGRPSALNRSGCTLNAGGSCDADAGVVFPCDCIVMLTFVVNSGAAALSGTLSRVSTVGVVRDAFGGPPMLGEGNGCLPPGVGGFPLPPRGPCGYLESTGVGNAPGPRLEALGPDGTSCTDVLSVAGGGGLRRPG